jgi:hypothetical protein
MRIAWDLGQKKNSCLLLAIPAISETSGENCVQNVKAAVGTSSNHLCNTCTTMLRCSLQLAGNTPSVEGVGTSTLDDRTAQDRLNSRDKTRLSLYTYFFVL